MNADLSKAGPAAHSPIAGPRAPAMATGLPLQPEAADLRVLVLTKRQYMGRDLLDDRYGRFRELPLALASAGANVHGICLSYRRRDRHDVIDRAGSAAVIWRSRNLSDLLSPGAAGYRRELDRTLAELRPNLVWACSDVAHTVLGVLACRRLRCRLVIDLYDNFESYPLARLPGVNRALAWAVGRANGVSCVSSPLRNLVRQRFGYTGPAEVIENAVDRSLFKPEDSRACRQALGLPANAILIGTAGAIHRSRGIETLFQAFAALAAERDDVHLVLAGPAEPGLGLPQGPRVHYLGNLPPTTVPQLLSALDLSVVCNRDSAFGRYCFPQKLYESVACEAPVLAARVGAVAELLHDFPDCTYTPDDATSLLSQLRASCERRSPLSIPAPTWRTQGLRLAAFFAAVHRAPAG